MCMLDFLRVLFIGLVLIPSIKVTLSKPASPVMACWWLSIVFVCHASTLRPANVACYLLDFTCLTLCLSPVLSIMQPSYVFLVVLLLLLEFLDKTATYCESDKSLHQNLTNLFFYSMRAHNICLRLFASNNTQSL